MVLDRRAGQRDAVAGLQRAGGLRLLGLRVLDVLRLVEDHAAQGTSFKHVEVAVQQGVAGEHQGVLRAPRFLNAVPFARARGRGGPAPAARA